MSKRTVSITTCDRCKHDFEPMPQLLTIHHLAFDMGQIDGGFSNSELDFCSDCSEQFYKWVKPLVTSGDAT